MTHKSFDFTALWLQSDDIIRSVAVLLLAMSLLTWYYIFMRGYISFYLKAISKRFEGFWHTQSYQDGLKLLGKPTCFNSFRRLADSAEEAVEHYYSHSEDLHSQLPLGEWISLTLSGKIDDEQEYLRRGMGVLASIGAVAPFVGLFGTVWGIYHALIGISDAGAATIASIAGPVGEALVMTALGLAVAIPAVLAYNTINRQNRQMMTRIHRFAQQLHTYHVSGITPQKVWAAQGDAKLMQSS